jgi:carbon monoxide dehydrogenase subunit G
MRDVTRLALLPLLLLFLLLPGCGADRARLQEARVSLLVDVSPAAAWQQLQDFSVAHNYVPGLTRTEIISSQQTGRGAHRRVYDAEGDYLEETIVEWHEGEGFVIDLHRGGEPMAPFRLARFRYALEPAGEERTRVTLALQFEMPLGGVGAALGEWLVKPAMVGELIQVGAGLKHFYETGTPAGDADRARLAGAVTPAA